MKLRRILIFLGLLGLVVIVAGNIGQWPKLTAAFGQVHWYVIPLLISMQLLSYWSNASFYQAFFRLNDHEVSFGKLTEVSLAINFANQAIPAGGVAGTTFLAEAVREEVPAGQATLSQLARYIFTFLSYFAVLALGFVLLFFGGNINKLSVRLMIIVMLVLLVGAVILLVVYSERRRLEATIRPFIKATNWFGAHVLRRSKPVIAAATLKRFFDEFYDAYHELAHNRQIRMKLWWWALAGNIFEVLSVYVVIISFGNWINLGVVIAAYTVAILASFAGVLTNGIGVYEAGMIGTLTALGQPFSVSVAVVLVYRVLSLVLFLPPGFYYYRKYLRTTTVDKLA